jgi:lipopolysaccharide transport system permease protein
VTETETELINEHWDKIIQPQRSLFDLRLGDLWKYRDLVMIFVRQDFFSVYKQTILGALQKEYLGKNELF